MTSSRELIFSKDILHTSSSLCATVGPREVWSYLHRPSPFSKTLPSYLVSLQVQGFQGKELLQASNFMASLFGLAMSGLSTLEYSCVGTQSTSTSFTMGFERNARFHGTAVWRLSKLCEALSRSKSAEFLAHHHAFHANDLVVFQMKIHQTWQSGPRARGREGVHQPTVFFPETHRRNNRAPLLGHFSRPPIREIWQASNLAAEQGKPSRPLTLGMSGRKLRCNKTL